MKTVTVSIVLDIEGSEADALHVVDRLLDNGVVQDPINEHEVDDAGPLHVTSAVVRLGAPPVADLAQADAHGIGQCEGLEEAERIARGLADSWSTRGQKMSALSARAVAMHIGIQRDRLSPPRAGVAKAKVSK